MEKEKIKKKVKAYLNTINLVDPRYEWIHKKYNQAYYEYIEARNKFWKIRDDYQSFKENREEKKK